MTKQRDDAEVPERTQRASARKLPDDYLMCRMMGHGPWERFAPGRDDINRSGWGTPVGWECGRCGMKRIDVIDSRGQVSWRKYVQPDHYRIPADKSPRRAALRLEFLDRIEDAAYTGF